MNPTGWPWPIVACPRTGDVRELENVNESAILLGSGTTIGAASFPVDRRASGTRLTIYAALRRTRPRRGRRLGLPRSAVYFKLEAMGMSARDAAQAKPRRRFQAQD